MNRDCFDSVAFVCMRNFPKIDEALDWNFRNYFLWHLVSV